MPDKKSTRLRTYKRQSGVNKTPNGFTEDERAAMRERARELKAEARENKTRAAGEKDVLAAIAKMPESDRKLAARLHELVKATAPKLSPKTWYGMPAYTKDEKIVCYFRPASKFKDRYATFGFNDKAKLDDRNMWPTSFAVTKLTPAEEEQITALIKKAIN